MAFESLFFILSLISLVNSGPCEDFPCKGQQNTVCVAKSESNDYSCLCEEGFVPVGGSAKEFGCVAPFGQPLKFSFEINGLPGFNQVPTPSSSETAGLSHIKQ